MRPLISVLTPTYNQEQFVGQCVESVLNQTYSDWEMLIVDDGSSDGTCDLVCTYTDERIRLIRQEHQGIWRLRDTYARALAHAQGTLVALLDGDDLWPEHKLEIQGAGFRDSDVVMSYGAYCECDRNGTVLSSPALPVRACGKVSGNDVARMMLRHEFIPYSVTVMARRQAIEDIGGFVQPVDLPLVDFPTWLNIVCGRRCVGYEEVLGSYRVHGGSVCRTFPEQIDEGVMRYGESFLDKSWERMALSAHEWRQFRRELQASYSHRRAYRRMQQGAWSEAIRFFGNAIRLGGPSRRVKSSARMAQAVGAMIWYEYVRKGTEG